MTEPTKPSEGPACYRFKSVPATIDYVIEARSPQEAITELEANPNEFTEDEWGTIAVIFEAGLEACEKADPPYLPLIAEAQAIFCRVMNAPKGRVIKVDLESFKRHVRNLN